MSSSIKKIYKKLPNFLQLAIKESYRRWNDIITLDEKMVDDLAEYFNVQKKEVVWLLKSGGRLNSDLWHIYNPKTDKEKDEFYQLTPFYIFDLAYWHMTRVQMKFRNQLSSLASGKVLDYGAGIGDFTLNIYKQDLSTDYADVGGRTFDFAKWLFQKNSANIKMIDLYTYDISDSYDTIFCVDVIEHLNNPKKVVTKLISHLNKDGKLIITALTINENSTIHPMHNKIDFDKNYLVSLGMKESKYPWLFIKQ